MSLNPSQSGKGDREQLGRLWPAPLERDLPEGRHNILLEYLMQEIDQPVAKAASPKEGTRSHVTRRPGVRLGWLTGGVAVTAMLAVAAAFAMLPGATTTGQTGQVTGAKSYDSLSAQQILLAAAEVAQNKSATSGKYWHTKVQSVVTGRPGTVTQTENEEVWATRTGEEYLYSPDANGVVLVTPYGGMRIGNALTLEDIEKLPTDPAALTAWAKDSVEHPAEPNYPLGKDEVVLPPPPASAKRGLVPGLLVDLLYEVPAPPAVRAAAFRALAALPNVTKIGAQDGGEALRIPAGDQSDLTVIIDPETSTLIGRNFGNGTSRVLDAEWTDTMPKKVGPN